MTDLLQEPQPTIPNFVYNNNFTLYSTCCSEEPYIRKKDDVEYYECPYCKEKCEVEWIEDECS